MTGRKGRRQVYCTGGICWMCRVGIRDKVGCQQRTHWAVLLAAVGGALEVCLCICLPLAVRLTEQALSWVSIYLHQGYYHCVLLGGHLVTANSVLSGNVCGSVKIIVVWL